MHFSIGVLMKKNDSLSEILEPYNSCTEDKRYIKFYEANKEEIDNFNNHNEYSNLDDYMKDCYGYSFNKEKQKYGYYTNVHSKWDWYQIGGRYSNIIINKSGKKLNFEYLHDIDWNAMIKDKIVGVGKCYDRYKSNDFMRILYDIKKNDTKESYVKKHSMFSLYGIVTADGKWIDRNDEEYNENWDEDFYNRFLKNADQNLQLIIVDCHY